MTIVNALWLCSYMNDRREAHNTFGTESVKDEE